MEGHRKQMGYCSIGFHFPNLGGGVVNVEVEAGAAVVTCMS